MGDSTQVTPELLNVRDVAKLTGLAERTVHRFADCGKMPAPVRIGGAVRWRAGEIREWIRNGCPPVRSPKAKGGAK